MKRSQKGCLCITCSLLLISVFWFSGVAGIVSRKLVLPLCLPFEMPGGFRVNSVGIENELSDQDDGIVLLVTPARAKAVMMGALPFVSRLVPPGFIADGVRAKCAWVPSGSSFSSGAIPIYIVIDRRVGDAPTMRGRIPMESVNRFLEEDLGDALSSREKWILGSYIISYKISLDEMTVLSDSPRNPVERGRKLKITALGRVRIVFDDDPVSVRATADVRKLQVELNMSFVPKENGYGLNYTARVTELRMNVNNVLKLGDEMIADNLTKSLERSMNRKKNRERAARLEIPFWFPLDTVIDFKQVNTKKLPGSVELPE